MIIHQRIRHLFLNGYLLLISIAALILCFGYTDNYYSTPLSVSIYIALISTFIVLFGKIRLALILSGYMIITLQLLSQLKVHYYKEKLLFSDLHVIMDWHNLETLLHYPGALAAIIGLIVLLIINIRLFSRVPSLKYTQRGYALLILVVALSIIVLLAGNENNRQHWQLTLPKGRGTLVNLLMSAQTMHYSPPEFSQSSTQFQHNTQFNYQLKPLTTKPDIVAFLQESTFNPALYTMPGVTLPSLAMFDVDSSVKAHSLLRVQAFGGATWLSEFAFLTGLNSGDFGLNKMSVFYNVAPNINNSLLKELKNNGYYTIILTPMAKNNYNASSAYHYFGVDLILQPQELGYPGELYQNLWEIPTQTMLDYAKQLLEKYTDKPLFIFVLSMNEHSPYHTDYPDNYQLNTVLQNQKTTSAINHYLSKLELLNQATQDFSNYIVKRNKPTMFLYFGDHQADVFWKGQYNTSLSNPQYLTQFYLKDNLPEPPSADIGPVTDIALLSGLLLERANLNVSPQFQANIKMRHLCQGTLADCADQPLVNSYLSYLYHDLKVAG